MKPIIVNVSTAWECSGLSLAAFGDLVENIARSVRRPQDGPDDEDDAPVVPTSVMPACTCPPCLAERARGERP